MVNPAYVGYDGEPLEVSERDHELLAIGDDNFKVLTWTELTDIVHRHELYRLARKPSELLHYLRSKKDFQRKYGGVLNYIIRERLKWRTEDGVIVPACETFLGSPLDVKILPNDFPYGLDDGIKHLVVWSKAKIPQDSTGRIAPEGAAMIEKYVTETFVKGLRMSPDNVLWFKNYAALQSVRELEHFHVLLKDPSEEDLSKLIGTSGSL